MDKTDLENTNSHTDLAESYLEKLTRLKAKYDQKKNVTQPSSSARTIQPSTEIKTTSIKPSASSFSSEGMPKPSLNDIKQQLSDVKANSPQKFPAGNKKIVYSPASASPNSSTVSSAALADLKNQLRMLRMKP